MISLETVPRILCPFLPLIGGKGTVPERARLAQLESQVAR